MTTTIQRPDSTIQYRFVSKQATPEHPKATTVLSRTVMSLNVHNISGTARFAPADLIDDVWPAITDRGTLPDILLLNELSKRNPGFKAFVEALKTAGYQVFTDPRPSNDHFNECLIASKGLPSTMKAEVLSPSTPSGLDYLAVKLMVLGKPVFLLSYRLHSFLNHEIQSAIHAGKLNACVENYKSIGAALPEFKALVDSFGEALIVAGGDNNHGAVRESYHGLAQKPASLSQQQAVINSLTFHTPESGYSNLRQHTAIDHILASPSIRADHVAYEVLSSNKLDHAAITSTIELRF